MTLHPYEKTISDLAKENDDLIICTAETRWAMRNLPEILGHRFMDVGISEQTLIGMAAGLSKMGMFPICHALASFLLMRPYEFIRTDLGYPNLKALLVGSFNGFISQANGPTHQAIDDISLMSNIPNMSIFAPSNIDETCDLLKLSIKHLNGPAYLRFNDGESKSKNKRKIIWGENIFHNRGDDTLVISYGLCFDIISEDFDSTFENLGLVNCIFIKPLSMDFCEKIFSEYQNIIVVEDHQNHGSLCYQLKNIAFDLKYSGKINSINLNDDFFQPGLLEDVLDNEGFSKHKLKTRINELL